MYLEYLLKLHSIKLSIWNNICAPLAYCMQTWATFVVIFLKAFFFFFLMSKCLSKHFKSTRNVNVLRISLHHFSAMHEEIHVIFCQWIISKGINVMMNFPWDLKALSQRLFNDASKLSLQHQVQCKMLAWAAQGASAVFPPPLMRFKMNNSPLNWTLCLAGVQTMDSFCYSF